MNKSITVNEFKQILNKFNDTDVIKIQCKNSYWDITNIEYKDNTVFLKYE